VLLTTAAVAVVWLVTAVFTWRSALHEIEELLNHPPATASHMQKERAELAGEIARHLLMPMPDRPAGAGAGAGGRGRLLAAAAAPPGRRHRRARAGPPDADRRTDTPREIVPLIERLNDLFAGIDRALENERRFTADASHELRTPLAALKAQAQVALAATDEAERRHALNQILVGCDRATHLLTQLLTLARLDAGTGQAMQELALRPLAEEVARRRRRRRHRARLRTGTGRRRCAGAGDPPCCRRCCATWWTTPCATPATQIEIAIVRQGKEAVLSVRDDGKGIPPATEAAISPWRSADFSPCSPAPAPARQRTGPVHRAASPNCTAAECSSDGPARPGRARPCACRRLPTTISPPARTAGFNA
jgi:signal transduction histidine kinase